MLRHWILIGALVPNAKKVGDRWPPGQMCGMCSNMTEQENSSCRYYIWTLDINTRAVIEPIWERNLLRQICESKHFTCQPFSSQNMWKIDYISEKSNFWNITVLESFLEVAVLSEERKQMWISESSLSWAPASSLEEWTYILYGKIRNNSKEIWVTEESREYSKATQNIKHYLRIYSPMNT